MTTEYIQVVTTVEHEEDARKIGAELVAQRLAACVQILGPITSIYRWQGKVETGGEYLCLIKSRRDLYDQLEAVVRELHPYEVPEILATAVIDGGSDYLDWLAGELKRK